LKDSTLRSAFTTKQEALPENGKEQLDSAAPPAPAEALEPVRKVIKMPSLEQLTQLLKSNHKIIDKFEENKTVVFDCSLAKLWELFFQDDCQFPFNQFQKDKIKSSN
jgi:hypothetical protein